MSSLSEKEQKRYQRHLQMPNIGSSGQLKLKGTHALIIGCGGLGAACSLYLAAAGIGQITLVDGDTVELGNLQRQITFSESDIGNNKAIATQNRLQGINADIKITAIDNYLTEKNAGELIGNADIVLDCSDDFNVRYLINDSCLKHGKAWVYASVFQMSGQIALFTPGQTCFRCVFPATPENQADCNINGVLGILPGVLGTLQATLAIRKILNLAATHLDQLLLFEAGDMSLQSIALHQNANCICTKASANDSIPQQTCDKNTAMPEQNSLAAKDFDRYANNPEYQLIDVRSHDERNNFHLGGTHIPIDELTADHDKLDTKKKLLLYCQSGMRSQLACDQLNAAGFKALNVDGGIIEILKYRP